MLFLDARDKHRRYQVFEHIAADQGYTSRIPNEKRGMSINEKHNEQQSIEPEMEAYMRAEVEKGVSIYELTVKTRYNGYAHTVTRVTG